MIYCQNSRSVQCNHLSAVEHCVGGERPVGVGEAVAPEVLTEEVLQYDTNCKSIAQSIQEQSVHTLADGKSL